MSPTKVCYSIVIHKHCCLYQGGYEFSLLVCLTACLLAGLRKNYSSGVHKVGRKEGGTWATEELIRFGGNPDHVTLELRLGYG